MILPSFQHPTLTAAFIMAEEGQSDDPCSKKLHPFFIASRTSKSKTDNIIMPITPESSCSSVSDKVPENIDDDMNHTNVGSDDAMDADLGTHRRKRRKTDSHRDSTQPVSKNIRPKRKSRVSLGASILDHLAPKGGSPVSDSVVSNDNAEAFPSTTTAGVPTPTPTHNTPALPQAVETNDEHDQHGSTEATTIPTKKLLILNPSTGTIGSPPKPKPITISNPVAPKKRGRKPKRLLASLRYGDTEASRTRIGQKINGILASLERALSTQHEPENDPEQERSEIPAPKKDSSKKPTPTKSIPNKPTHPFFLGKNKPDAETTDEEKKDDTKKAPKRHSIFTSTPCSPNRFHALPQKFNVPQFGLKSGGLKVPGAQYPAWPWREIAHVRDDARLPQSANDEHALLPSKRKAKRREVRVGATESVLYRAGVDLKIAQLVEEMEALNAEDFQPPHPLLRIPTRYLESGKKLQARIAPQLHTRVNGAPKAHPAISHAFKSLQSMLSAFDRATCETSTWAHKYAPSSAACVLQNGRDAELLRDWLATLKVQAVDTGLVEGSKPKPAPVAQKRGRKKKKLDGFIVSSDEEDMDELSEDEDGWAPSSQTNSKRTVVKSTSKSGSRLTNAVLLSGPHGCGKTAAVFAIAKELDFEVFEISPGSRRSGRDIIEKVGDMTRNHLVQHQQKEDGPAEDPLNDPLEDPMEDQVAQDLKSGKQGMMTSFFKPNPTAQATKPKKRSKTNSKTNATQPKGSLDSSTSLVKPQKQKQSLILLEEVDVLYEEDRQFWATIISMISQSKRPFIMTCNDETLVPIQSLNLHGIFRFSNPPKELALDLLILIAANEGHVLSRDAVETLYDSRQHDLRASITELNYWCQLGVGDPRGGFDWFYPRWPKGADVDNEGNTIRVVSEGTYQRGMGWLGRDVIATTSPSQSTEEELQRQTWQSWSLDLCNSQELEAFPSWANILLSQDYSTRDRCALLMDADEYACRMSDADLCSFGTYAQLDKLSIDPSLPALPTKIKEDFIIGRQLLEAEPLIYYDTISNSIATALKLFSRSHLLRGSRLFGADGRTTPTIMYPLQEPRALDAIEQSCKVKLQPDPTIARVDYSIAFDPLAVSERTAMAATASLDPSVFDRTMRVIALDVAPYVRGIVAYDQRLQRERLLRNGSSLVSEGGGPANGKKRMRNTRSAYSALEGGSRASTRRERYFAADINPHLVLRTGGEGWEALLPASRAEGLGLGFRSGASSRSGSVLPSSPEGDDDTDVHPGY